MVVEKHLPNKSVYDRIKKDGARSIVLSIGNGFDEYRQLYYFDINLCWHDKKLDFQDSTTKSYYFNEYQEIEALKQAKKDISILERTLKNRGYSVINNGLENC